MTIEFLGTGGSGKSTLEPLLAEALDIPYFPGKKRHDFAGDPLSRWGVWVGRAQDALSSPSLMLMASRAPGNLPNRARFALDVGRRERLATRAHEFGTGVVGSGGLHRLCAWFAHTGFDVSDLANRITPADIYILLLIDPEEATRRLSHRLGDLSRDLSRHDEWTEAYIATARRLANQLSHTVIEVEATGNPGNLVDQLCDLVRTSRPS